MPIEFQCSGCNQTLRVPDDSAGKQAKCPKCDAIVPVPLGSESPHGQQPPPFSAASDTPFGESLAGQAATGSNPFSDQTGMGPGAIPYSPPKPVDGQWGATPGDAVIGDTVVPTPVEAGDVINYAWEVWKANLGLLVGVFVLIAVVGWLFNGLQSGLQFALQQADFGEGEAALLTLPINLIGSIAQFYLGIGQATIGLRLARGRRAEFSDVFSAGSLFLPVLGGSILFYLAMGMGFVLLVIPGIIVAVLFWSFYFLIIERKAGVIESFSVSYDMCKQNVGTTLVLFLAGMGITILGLLACGFGLLLAAPLAQMLWVVGYLMMSGQLPSRMPYSAIRSKSG